MTAFLSAVRSEPDSWRLILLSQQAADPGLLERVLRGRKAQTERMTELVTAQFTTRGIADAERKAELVAHVIVATGESAAALLLEHPGRWEPAELAEQLARLIVRGAGRL